MIVWLPKRKPVSGVVPAREDTHDERDKPDGKHERTYEESHVNESPHAFHHKNKDTLEHIPLFDCNTV